MATIGENIRRIRKLKGMTLEGVSVPAGTDTGNLSRIERGLQGATEELLLNLARVLEVHRSEFLMDNDNVRFAPTLRPFKRVPVVGTVQGGDNGFFTEEYAMGDSDGEITYPAKDDNTYALRVRGDSMRPRIKNGEFIVVEPNHQPQPGDDVVVCLTDGRKMVKEMLYVRDGDLTLGSINDGHGNITVPMQNVEKLHYVAAIIPRGAFYKQN